MSHPHSLPIETGDSIFSFLHINIHGLAMPNSLYRNQITKILSSKPNIISLNELNVNIHHEELYRKIYQGWILKGFPVSVVMNHNHDPVNDPKDLSNDITKYGGVAMAATGRTSSRVVTKDKDPFGRWIRYTLVGKGCKKVSFITAYQCCKGSINQDIDRNTVYAQEYRCAVKQGHDMNVCPRSLFVEELSTYIDELMEQGQEVIVAMDANETPTCKNGILAKLQSMGMIDVHNVLHPDEAHPCTYKHGRECIDYMLVTPGVIPSLMRLTYHPFEEYHSDHKALELHLNPTVLFGSSFADSQLQPKGRTIRTLDSKTSSKYCALLDQLVKDHKLEDRAKKLEFRFAKYGLDERNRKAINALDRELGQLIIQSERKSVRRQQGYGESFWSPTIHNTGLTLLNLRRVIRSYKHRGNVPPEIYTEYRNALANHKHSKKLAYENRLEFLSDLAMEYSVKRNVKYETACKILKRAMESKKLYMTLRKMRTTSPPLSSLLVRSSSSAEYESVVDTEDIFNHLVQRNVSVLKGGLSSRLIQSKLLGDKGMSDAADKLLNGSIEGIDLRQFEEYEINFLKALARPIEIPEMDGNIDGADVARIISKTRESTESSPSGRSYSHYKAILQYPSLMYLFSFLIVIPFRYGFSLDRWSRTTQVMLLKKDLPYIDRLRIIELFEGDYNSAVKILMRRLLFHIHKQRSTPISGIFGTIKGGSSMEAVLSRVFCYDNSRIMRTPMAVLDNDAKSCYDRIPVPVAGVCLRRLNVPDNVVSTFTEQLHNRVRDIKIAQGLSRETITEDKYGSLCGVGQGNAGGPATWHAILETLVQALTLSVPYRFVAIHPGDRSCYTLPITSYVDDCSSAVNTLKEHLLNMEHQSKALVYQELLNKLGIITKCWVSLLRFSGGDLEVHKSYVLLVDWKTSKGKVVCKTNEDIRMEGIEVSIPIEDGINLPWKDSNQAERYLGVRISPSGDRTVELEYLRQESKSFGLKLKQMRLTPRECWIAYMTMWKPKVSYPLPATSFTRQECVTKINGPCEALFLARIGVNRHYPKIVAHAPCKLGGLGLYNTYVEQGLAHVKWLLGIIKTPTCQIRPLLMTNIALTQIESGVSIPIFQLSKILKKQICKYLTPTWITYTLGFMAEYDIDIFIDEVTPDSCSKLWTGDSFIMDGLLNLHWGDREIKIFNHCRLYFCAKTCSDIIDNTGRYFMDSCRYECLRSGKEYENVWPYRSVPTEAMLKVWRRGLKQLYEYNGYNDNTLRQPLVRIPPPMLALPDPNRGIDEEIPMRILRVMGIDPNTSVEWQQLLRVCSQVTHLVACSDGSAKDGKGSYAFTIRTYDGEVAMDSQGHVYGSKINSFRAEVFGLVSVSLVLHSVKKQLGNACLFKDIKVYCDNDQAVRQMNCLPTPSPLTWDSPCNDLFSLLQTFKSEGVCIRYAWVKGHQNCFIGPLTHESIMNIDCDIRARSHNYNIAPLETHPLDSAYVSIQGHPMIGYTITQLREHILAIPMKQYIIKKERWVPETFALVDWEAFHKVLKEVPRGQTVTYSKLIHRWTCASGRIAHYQDETSEDELCIKCMCEIETIEHIFSCHWTSEIEGEFLQSIIKIGSHPAVVRIIRQYFLPSIHNPDMEYLFEGDQLVDALLQEQTQIGWGSTMLRGRISQRWQEFHSDDRWSKRFVDILLKYGVRIWSIRNNYIHNPEPNQLVTQRQREVEKLYKLKNQIPKRFHKRLFPPMNDVIDKNPKMFDTWKKSVHLLATTGDNLITRYFGKQHHIIQEESPNHDISQSQEHHSLYDNSPEDACREELTGTQNGATPNNTHSHDFTSRRRASTTPSYQSLTGDNLITRYFGKQHHLLQEGGPNHDISQSNEDQSFNDNTPEDEYREELTDTQNGDTPNNTHSNDTSQRCAPTKPRYQSLSVTSEFDMDVNVVGNLTFPHVPPELMAQFSSGTSMQSCGESVTTNYKRSAVHEVIGTSNFSQAWRKDQSHCILGQKSIKQYLVSPKPTVDVPKDPEVKRSSDDLVYYDQQSDLSLSRTRKLNTAERMDNQIQYRPLDQEYHSPLDQGSDEGNIKIQSHLHSRANNSTSSEFMNNRTLSNAELDVVLGRLHDPTLWIENGIFVKKGIMLATVTYESYRRLRWTGVESTLERWINDEIINSFTAILANREHGKVSANPWYKPNFFFSTFLFPRFLQFGYKAVQRWGRKSTGPYHILEGKYLFVPINQEGQHWVLVVGDIPTRTLWFLDPYQWLRASHQTGAKEYYCSVIKEYLEMECRLNDEVIGEIKWVISDSEWDLLPKQMDGYSCGLFVLAFIESIVDGVPMQFVELDMQRGYRQYVANELDKHWKERPQNNSNGGGDDNSRRNIVNQDGQNYEEVKVFAVDADRPGTEGVTATTNSKYACVAIDDDGYVQTSYVGEGG